jgi:hypothetical protein
MTPSIHSPQAYIPGMDRRDIEVFVSGPHFDVATVKGVKLPSERELMLLIRESTSLEHMLRLGANRCSFIYRAVFHILEILFQFQKPYNWTAAK